MKAGFGLAALLIVVGLVVWMQAKNAETVLNKSKGARQDAAQFAGQDIDGVKAKDSITLEPTTVNGRFRSMRVKTLMPAGPMEAYYGLKVGDEIINANQLDLKDYDSDLGQAMVLESYSRKLPLIVMRGNEKVRLPIENGATPPQTANPATDTGVKPVEPAADPNRSTIQGQLDKIPGIKR
jgi:hypothetical protein